MPYSRRVAGVDIKRTLPVHLTWMVGLVIAWISWGVAAEVRFGVDSHAYWAVWQADWRRDMYDIAPGRVDAYNYSPAFAFAIWPFSHLSWPVFGVLWSMAATVALIWLLRPLGSRWVFPLLLCAAPEILSGNIFWLLALSTVWGLHPAPKAAGWWAVAALTKVTVALGPIWFVVRREWRHAAWSVVTTAVVVGATLLVTPDLWRQWWAFLLDNEASSTSIGSSILPPLVWRLPIALLLTVWAALTDQKRILPVALVLATPVAGPAAFVMLAAIPRVTQSSDQSRM